MEIRTITTSYMGSHSYILIDDGHGIVIDPGDAEFVVNAIQ